MQIYRRDSVSCRGPKGRNIKADYVPRGFYANFRWQPFACILCMPLPFSDFPVYFFWVLSLVQLANNSILFDLISFVLFISFMGDGE